MESEIRIPFCTPPVSTVSEPDTDTQNNKEWLSATLRVPAGETTSGGTSKPPLIIICHGIGAHKNHPALLPALANLLPVASLRFDFRGCGNSSGAVLRMIDYLRCVDDLALVVGWATTRFQIEAIAGHSMGSLVVLLHSLRFPHVTPRLINISGRFHMKTGLLAKIVRDKIVTSDVLNSVISTMASSPLADSTIHQEECKESLNSTSFEVTVNGWRGGATDIDGSKIKGRRVAYSVCLPDAIHLWETLDSMITTAKDHLPVTLQTLTVHGEDDEIVPSADAYGFSQMLPGNTLVLIKHGNHNLTSESDGGIKHMDLASDAIITWLRDHGAFAAAPIVAASNL
ncbi:Alpha/Beta hydrolase protein [Obelidium mucronatum]|nr:Alpha/Beta hydrolase protein [Obelidium mucronatum]